MKPLRHSLVPAGPGHRTPQTQLLIDERNRLLIAAATFFPGASDREIARRLHQVLNRYASGAWRRESTCEVCPARHRGKVTAALWMILKIHDHVPSVGTVRAALARKGNSGFR